LWRRKNKFKPIRGQARHLEFQIPTKSSNTPLEPLKEHFMEICHKVVLEKKAKILQPIKDGCHLGFRTPHKSYSTSLEPLEEHVWYVP